MVAWCGVRLEHRAGGWAKQPIGTIPAPYTAWGPDPLRGRAVSCMRSPWHPFSMNSVGKEGPGSPRGREKAWALVGQATGEGRSSPQWPTETFLGERRAGTSGSHLSPQSSLPGVRVVMSFLGPEDESRGRKAPAPAPAPCPEPATLGATNTHSCSHPITFPKLHRTPQGTAS